MAVGSVALLALLGFAGSGVAPHFYRNSGGGCTEADGRITDDPPGGSGPLGADVLILHTGYLDLHSATPVTQIRVGQSVTWHWGSLHCHSVTSGLVFSANGAFASGFHYPKQTGFPSVSPGLFHYPIPTTAPELSYTHTFLEPGTFTYFCVHHWELGMQGVVVVEAA